MCGGDAGHGRWKQEVVLETLVEGTTVTEMARRRGFDRSLIYRWRREMKVSRRGAGERFVPVQLVDTTAPTAAPHGIRPTDGGDDRCREEAVAGRKLGPIVEAACWAMPGASSMTFMRPTARRLRARHWSGSANSTPSNSRSVASRPTSGSDDARPDHCRAQKV